MCTSPAPTAPDRWDQFTAVRACLGPVGAFQATAPDEDLPRLARSRSGYRGSLTLYANDYTHLPQVTEYPMESAAGHEPSEKTATTLTARLRACAAHVAQRDDLPAILQLSRQRDTLTLLHCRIWSPAHHQAEATRLERAARADGDARNWLWPRFRESPGQQWAGTAEPIRADIPSPRKITSWIMRPQETLTESQDERLLQVRLACPDITRACDLARAFADPVRHRREFLLLEWIRQAEQDAPKPMQGFAGFLRQDLDAVTAGLTLPWSSGAVEGNVNRVKTLKRAMYGRASFSLLRTRILIRP